MTDPVLEDMVQNCVLSRARLISRVLTGVYDGAMHRFDINSPQFALLVAIYHIGPANRSEIGRFTRQDRSTMSRNMQPLLKAGWIEEVENAAGGRSRPIALTASGLKLLHDIAPVWQAAQDQANLLLGEAGASTVTALADALFASRED